MLSQFLWVACTHWLDRLECGDVCCFICVLYDFHCADVIVIQCPMGTDDVHTRWTWDPTGWKCRSQCSSGFQDNVHWILLTFCRVEPDGSCNGGPVALAQCQDTSSSDVKWNMPEWQQCMLPDEPMLAESCHKFWKGVKWEEFIKLCCVCWLVCQTHVLSELIPLPVTIFWLREHGWHQELLVFSWCTMQLDYQPKLLKQFCQKLNIFSLPQDSQGLQCYFARQPQLTNLASELSTLQKVLFTFESLHHELLSCNQGFEDVHQPLGIKCDQVPQCFIRTENNVSLFVQKEKKIVQFFNVHLVIFYQFLDCLNVNVLQGFLVIPIQLLPDCSFHLQPLHWSQHSPGWEAGDLVMQFTPQFPEIFFTSSVVVYIEHVTLRHIKFFVLCDGFLDFHYKLLFLLNGAHVQMCEYQNDLWFHIFFLLLFLWLLLCLLYLCLNGPQPVAQEISLCWGNSHPPLFVCCCNLWLEWFAQVHDNDVDSISIQEHVVCSIELSLSSKVPQSQDTLLFLLWIFRGLQTLLVHCCFQFFKLVFLDQDCFLNGILREILVLCAVLTEDLLCLGCSLLDTAAGINAFIWLFDLVVSYIFLCLPLFHLQNFCGEFLGQFFSFQVRFSPSVQTKWRLIQIKLNPVSLNSICALHILLELLSQQPPGEAGLPSSTVPNDVDSGSIAGMGSTLASFQESSGKCWQK